MIVGSYTRPGSPLDDASVSCFFSEQDPPSTPVAGGALIVRIVPGVRKAVRWNSPFYGIEDQGWFLSYHVFTRYVKVTFLQGASLRPVPPGSGKDRDSRWIDIYEGELDVEQMAVWIRQAAAIPGWRGF